MVSSHMEIQADWILSNLLSRWWGELDKEVNFPFCFFHKDQALRHVGRPVQLPVGHSEEGFKGKQTCPLTFEKSPRMV